VRSLNSKEFKQWRVGYWVTTPALASSKSNHVGITVKYSTQLWHAVRMASRSCLTTVGVCCLVHQELWKQDLRTTRYPLPSLTQLLEKFWVGSEALRLGSLSCLQLWVLTARLTKAPSASSVNHMFPFLLPPKCNGLLYGIWKLLDQQVKHWVLQFCCICAELRLFCTTTTQTFLWPSLGLEPVGHIDQWDPAWSAGCIPLCT
jgi:hypothetical protein